MKVNGQLVTCDRCGKTAFAKAIVDKEMDGGFTRWTEFERLEGWSNQFKIGDLCPECTEAYNNMIENFKAYKEAP